MSGILPMKVIKVGTSSQSRIAQACDRCRSKKIRCDGVRPCCSQCASVGFECKTSDKLSRRAFPRGYTESLEERVRSLEAEVRELRELLGEKSEKIDNLSSIRASSRASNSPASPTPSAEACAESPLEEGVFHVQTSSLLLGSESSHSLFVSDSSGRAFVDALKRKIQESGKSCPDFNTEAFLNMQTPPSIRSAKPALEAAHPLPRLFSDRCVQIFFEEWTPLFPVLHRPTFLGMYEEYVSGSERMMNDRELAQLHLVFGIAALSSNMPDKDHIDFCEDQWRASLDSLSMDNTLPTLQNYVLAILYCILKGDRQRLQQHYRGMAVELSHRLGLHQSQKVFSIGALTAETRRKVFWTLYTVECFSSALLGLPTLLAKGNDIQCEYPTAIDDEYVTEEGFLPTLPGELPRISAALALFRVSRILSSVLCQNYHTTASHEDSLQPLPALEAELNNWSNELPSHLKLNFERDKPPTNVRGSRSALLSLSYHYIRSLIHRPAVGSSSGSKASPSITSLADSSKHIVQIVEFLEERSLSFSFCLNKNETLVLCGLSLLYQSLHLKQEGQFMKDEQQPVRAVVRCLEMGQAPMAGDFREVAASIILIDSRPEPRDCQALENKVAMPTAELAASLPVTGSELFHQSTYPSLSLSAGIDILSRQNHHNAAFPKQAMQGTAKRGRLSLDSARAQPSFPRHEYRSSVSLHPAIANSHFSSSPQPCQNLDYLSLHDGSSTSQSASPSQLRPLHSISHKFGSQLTSPSLTSVSSSCNLNPSPVTPIEWESLYSSPDSGRSNIFNAMYGSPPNLAPSQSHSHSLQSETLDWAEPHPASERTTISNPSFSAYCSNWNPASWGVSAASMHDFGVPQQPSLDPSAQSALNAREGSLNAGDGRRSSEFVAANGGGGGVGDRSWIADMRF